ncbi:hypothetical protein [Pontibacter roseus]|uniref:hypothetical protein n=1 Tax=Pontibacter roseus TaxID=336989 RepID=UPI0003A76559|nr:hypothetical protein [Pontibacter roseus]
MKKFYTIATALLLVAGSFTSCTKDLDEVGLNASATEAAKINAQASKKATPSLSLSFSESPVVVGTPVTIMYSVGAPADGGAAPTKGTLILQRAKLSETGAYTDVATAAYWEDVVTTQVQKTGTSFTHTYTPDATGTFGWRVKYAGGGQDFEGTESAADIVVVNPCTGATLSTSLVSATPVEGGLTEYKVALKLSSCAAYANVKLQGGISATLEGSVSAVSANGVAGQIDYNNRNAVISWKNLNVTDSYSNTFYVTFRKYAKAGEGLTGDWTAKVGEETIASSPEFSLSN